MSNVSRDSVSYRRGLVLGLTMAEIMLLLVFCLLIALAALISRSREKLAEAEKKVAELTLLAEGNTTLGKETVEALREQAAAEKPGASPEEIKDTWTRLVADTGIVQRLRDAGLDPAVLVTARDIRADVAIADTVRAILADEALPSDPEAAAAAVRERLAAGRAAEAKIAALEEDVAALNARAGKRVDLPPIVTLREDRGFYFGTGSAVLSESAAAQLHDQTVGDLVDLISRYDVDVIEVIGHTDERRVASSKVSNLDDTLLAAVNGGPIEALAPADNAGLGLARAVAVAQVLKSDKRLSGYDILPLSAAQLVGTDGRLTAGGGGDEQERRRIEIRLRRSNERVETPSAGTPAPSSGG